MAAYQSTFDAEGNPADLDGEGGLAARLVPMAEVSVNGHDLNIGRYIRQVAAEAEDLGTLIDAYNLARAERQKTEADMLAVLAEAGIEGFDE